MTTLRGNETTPAEYERLVQRDFLRNAIAFTGWEFVWAMGMVFALFATFTPAYLNSLGAPKYLIGLVLTFPVLAAPGQVAISYFVPARLRMSVLKWVHIGCILPWLVCSVVSVAWGAHWSAGVHIWLFVIVQAVFIGGCFAAAALYWEIMTDNTPMRRRGVLVGVRVLGWGVAALLMSGIASRVQIHWPEPVNFRIGFIIGTSIYLLSCSALWFARDHINPAHSSADAKDRPPLLTYLRGALREVWHEPNYRIFLFFHTLLVVAIAGSAFIIAGARDELGASAQQLGRFSIVFLVSIALLSWALGLLADRYGYRATGCAMALLLAGTFVICLATDSIIFWYVAYGAAALSSMMRFALLSNMGAEICPAIRPNRLMAIGNSLQLVFVVAANTLAGASVDLFGAYRPVFVANLVVCLVAALGFAIIVREPRSGRLYMMKMTPRS